jgi:hypothetical protein
VTLKKKLALTIATLCILLSACTLGSLSAEQLEATAHDLSSTWIALTLTALPSNTTQPSDTPQPTSTPTQESSATQMETATVMPTAGPTFAPTWTPYGQSGAFEEAKSDKADFNAPLLISNQSGEDVHFIMLTPVYQEYDLGGSMTLILPEGSYTFRAKIGKNAISGSFAITNGDKHVLTLYENKYHFATP